MPLPLLALLPTLLELAPKLAGMIAGKDAEEAAQKAVRIAQDVTGAQTPEDAIAALKADSAARAAFEKAVLDNKLAFESLRVEEVKAVLGDTQDARERDVKLRELGYRNLRSNAMLGGAAVLVAVILAVAVWKSGLGEFEKGILTLVLGRALGYIDQGFSFEFGTTRSSMKKDETISQLTR